MNIEEFNDACDYAVEQRIKSILINRFATAVMTADEKCKNIGNFYEAAFGLYQSNQKMREWVDKTASEIIRAIKTPNFLTVTAY